jgi:transposase-like protein
MSIMEHVEQKRARQRRSFTVEFKAEIVELCQRGDRSVGQVARDFDLTEAAVREWVKQAGVTRGRAATPSIRSRCWSLLAGRRSGGGREHDDLA